MLPINAFIKVAFFKASALWADAFYKSICPYGRKSVDRIATQSMSKICNLLRLIVGDCDYAESYIWFLSGGNADASHGV